MRKHISVALVVLFLFASQAFGDAQEHSDIALGFHHSAAPLGARCWLNSNQSVGLDIGVGVSSNDTDGDSETDVTLDLGLPLLLKSWEKAHFLFRPGFMYEIDAELLGNEIERGSVMSFLAELEAEVFITDNFSVSASNGIGVFVTDPPESDGEDIESTTNLSTFGNNITEIGFHLYGVWD